MQDPSVSLMSRNGNICRGHNVEEVLVRDEGYRAALEFERRRKAHNCRGVWNLSGLSRPLSVYKRKRTNQKTPGKRSSKRPTPTPNETEDDDAEVYKKQGTTGVKMRDESDAKGDALMSVGMAPVPKLVERSERGR
ncbi:hypothetical protein F5887DRAFT_925543 [Amanita rubescens]|nr:hypothetical protein F5887DRAFT_925543 [Amanita rubescens]